MEGLDRTQLEGFREMEETLRLENGSLTAEALKFLMGLTYEDAFGQTDFIWTQIKELGIEPGLKELPYEENIKERQALASRICRGFHAMGAPWGLKCTQDDGKGTVKVGVMPEYVSIVPPLMRSVYGHCETAVMETEHVEFEEPAREGTIYGMLKSVRKRKEGDPEERLPDSVIKGLLESSMAEDYEAELFFYPVPEKKISDREMHAEALSSKLSLLAKISMQMGKQTSDQSNLNTGANVIAISKGKSSSSTAGNTTTFSLEQESAFFTQICTQLEDEQRRLSECKKEGGYLVLIRVHAKNSLCARQTAAVLEAALGGLGKFFCWDNRISECGAVMKTSELGDFTIFPDRELPGLGVWELEPFALNPVQEDKEMLLEAGGIRLGQIVWNKTKLASQARIAAQELKRHAFVCGMTGSGKTNTVFGILRRLGVPFLVIEPVKSEYGALKKRLPELNVWELDATSPNVLMYNPFWFPKGSSVQYHMDIIKSVISSAFSLSAAMPNILEQCIFRIYRKKGWSVENNHNQFYGELPEECLYPIFDDLCDEVERYLDESSYEGETLATYRGALASRLKSFTTGVKGALLNTTRRIDFAKWLQNPQIVVLDALSDDDDKAVIMGSLMMQYFEFLKLQPRSQMLCHLTVIEEAHRLFKKEKPGAGDPEKVGSDVRLNEILSNMMAEIRAYGEGLVIVDQSPTAVSESVIKNSNVKIVHRLDSMDDMEAIGRCLAMDESLKSISTLGQGTMLMRCNGMMSPMKAAVDKEKDDLGFSSVDETEEKSGKVFYSSFADMAMQDRELEDMVCSIMEKAMNHFLFDHCERLYLVIEKAKKEIKRQLIRFGYGIETMELQDVDYHMLLMKGLRAYLLRDEKYGRNFKLVQLILLAFDRLIESLRDHAPFTPEELRLFASYREFRIYPLLRSIHFIYYFNGREEYEDLLNYRKMAYARICMEAVNEAEKSITEESSILHKDERDEESMGTVQKKEMLHRLIGSKFLLEPEGALWKAITELAVKTMLGG